MKLSQEPKYTALHGQIVNRTSGEAIPDDEPVFIFRARDWWAATALAFYAAMCRDPGHRTTVENRVNDFLRFRSNYPNRMKEPDSP